MPYNVEPLRQAQTRDALIATGFVKLCEHGHLIHTPNNSPLPAHNADYHDPDRNGIGGHYPDPNGTHGQGDLRFDQFHEKDLTGRGYDADEIIRHLIATNGDVSMCSHGAVVNNSSGSCHTGAHTPPYMRGVERNMPSRAQDDALTDPLEGHEWRQHHTWNWETVDDDDYRNNGYPRTEEELVREEPERVAGIKERIGKVVSLANSPRFQKSDYTAHSFPSGRFYDSHHIDDRSPEQAEDDGLNWGQHTVIGYHKGTAVGRLDYNSKGEVGGWYVDHNHQNGPVSVKMLAAAHQHLLDLGNPIGMLKSDTTSSNSAAVIKKIDPESTYLRLGTADSGWNRDYNWEPRHHDDRILPLLPEHSERRDRYEWKELSEKTGLNIHELHAISSDETNRDKADVTQLGDEAMDIRDAYFQERQRKVSRGQVKVKTNTRDGIAPRIAAFSIPAGYLGDTANLETQMPKETAVTIGQSYPHHSSWQRTADSAGLDTMEDVNSLSNLTSQTRQQIVTNRSRSSERMFDSQRDADIRRGKNPDEELTQRVSEDASGVWTGDDDPRDKDPAERARALMATPRHRRPF